MADAEEDVYVEAVIMCGVGTGGGAGGRVEEGGGFDFVKTFRPIKFTEGFDEFGTEEEAFHGGGVGD